MNLTFLSGFVDWETSKFENCISVAYVSFKRELYVTDKKCFLLIVNEPCIQLNLNELTLWAFCNYIKRINVIVEKVT